MAQVTFPRRAVSTATTITVNSNALPSWLPAPGYWSTPSNPVSGSKPASLNTASSQMGNFPPHFLSGRFFESLWNDYSGAVWNPYIGTYGAMLFHGGGHMAGQKAMADNGVYMWRADTREWSRLADVGWPGEVTDTDWFTNGPYSTLYNTPSGEVATGVPAANHSRSVPCILSPAWSGSAGGFCLPSARSIGNIGDLSSNFPHALNCATALSVGSAAAGQSGGGWSRLGGAHPSGLTGIWAATADNVRGNLYIQAQNNGQLWRFNITANTWTDVSPSGYGSSGFQNRTLEYAPSLDCVIQMDANYDLAFIPAGGSPLTLTKRTTAGTKPTPNYDSDDGAGYGFIWCPDIPPYGAVVHLTTSNLFEGPMLFCDINACTPSSSNPLTATWTWSKLVANNMPTTLHNPTSYMNNRHLYKRFQYAPALKSFFFCTMPNDTYGGIVCFRPSEIP
jgi:hypothetical protein